MSVKPKEEGQNIQEEQQQKEQQKERNKDENKMTVSRRRRRTTTTTTETASHTLFKTHRPDPPFYKKRNQPDPPFKKKSLGSGFPQFFSFKLQNTPGGSRLASLYIPILSPGLRLAFVTCRYAFTYMEFHEIGVPPNHPCSSDFP